MPPTTKIIDGNTAVAEAMRQINPDVVGAFPITPTTSIMEKFSEICAKGKATTELILAESEHASMSICVGAAAGGGRAMTATASQGLELMHEVLFNASGMRLPIVLINGNRALSAPLSIHGDHADINAVRDTGWLIIHAKDAQEAYDFTLQAFRIAEHLDVRTPIIIAMDGFSVTHTKQKVLIEDDEAVKKFLGEVITVNPLLDIENPVSYGAATKPDYFMECKRSQLEGILNARRVIPEIGKEFGAVFGRNYESAGEEFMLDDAEYAIVVMGSLFGTLKEGIRALRNEGIKIGVLRVRTYRPFSEAHVREKLAQAKNIAVLERTYPAGGAGGPLFTEVRSALYGSSKAKILPFTIALGGREFYPEDVEKVYEILKTQDESDNHESFWIGLR